MEQGLQGVVKDRVLEDLHHVPAEVEGHELHEVEGDGELVLHGVQQRPEVLAVDTLGVDGEPGHLEGLQVPVDGPGVAVQVIGQFGRRFPQLGGE